MFSKVLKQTIGYFNRNNQYQKFVIIAQSRTGSNLLCSFLNSHPEINAGDELFKTLNGKTCQEVWDAFFGKKNKFIKYAGFKIFYYHPAKSDDKSVWDIIENDKNIKIIHLRRENLLRRYMSKKIAFKTNVWHAQNAKTQSTSSKEIKIDIAHCLYEFKSSKNKEQLTEKRFAQHPYLELTYEKLTANPQKVMNELYSFFGLKDYPVKTKLRRQNPEKTQELVSNYGELKEALIAAGYADFLKEK